VRKIIASTRGFKDRVTDELGLKSIWINAIKLQLIRADENRHSATQDCIIRSRSL
jgi:hypothetical protein